MAAPMISRRARQTGFSLFEMLAVLAIMGVILAVTAPSLGRIIDSYMFNSKADGFERGITALRVQAYTKGRRFVLGAGAQISEADNPPIAALIAAGWTFAGDDIVILETGVCLGGDIALIAPSGRSRVYALDAPACEPKRVG
ncbi:MAG: type II secretion system protein [Pseudomonadota bacterium]